MRVLFCGGGTAGHVTPAIAIAEIIQNKYKDTAIAFVGRYGGDENSVVTRLGYKLYTLDISGIKRSLSLSNIKSVYKAIRSKKNARKIIRDFLPDIVIGTGGYVCWPIISAALKMKIPTVMHESNAYPGLVTRMLGHKCDALLLGLDGAKKHLGRAKNIETVGNPLRMDFERYTRKEARELLGFSPMDTVIVSFGGSGGSDRMNEVIVEMMKTHSVPAVRVRHIHATGRRAYQRYRDQEPELCRGINKCKLVPYIDNMPVLLKCADITITRSGAMTLAELSGAGAAPILIPSPNVTANHQFLNAKFISDNKGAILIEEDNLTADSLLKAVTMLEENERKRKEMAFAIKAFSQHGNEEKILDTIVKAIYSRKTHSAL